MRVAFQGERGAYSEGAAVALLGESVDAVPCESFEDVFVALAGGEVDRAMLPIENSLAGSIHRNFDLMLRHELHIVDEIAVRIAHNLLVLPGVALADIRTVISHPQALAQCEHTLTAMGVRREAAWDTAGSARRVAAEGLRDVGAIASRRAAEVWGLEIARENIEDDPENFTRFHLLGREASLPPDGVDAKTSIVFSLDDSPGVLFKALSVFALRDIDLTKIESRPLRGQRWRYLFYIDFVARLDSGPAQNALRHLQEIAPFLRVLGCYPRRA